MVGRRLDPADCGRAGERARGNQDVGPRRPSAGGAARPARGVPSAAGERCVAACSTWRTQSLGCRTSAEGSAHGPRMWRCTLFGGDETHGSALVLLHMHDFGSKEGSSEPIDAAAFTHGGCIAHARAVKVHACMCRQVAVPGSRMQVACPALLPHEHPACLLTQQILHGCRHAPAPRFAHACSCGTMNSSSGKTSCSRPSFPRWVQRPALLPWCTPHARDVNVLLHRRHASPWDPRI